MNYRYILEFEAVQSDIQIYLPEFLPQKKSWEKKKYRSGLLLLKNPFDLRKNLKKSTVWFNSKTGNISALNRMSYVDLNAIRGSHCLTDNFGNINETVSFYLYWHLLVLKMNVFWNTVNSASYISTDVSEKGAA
jgi:hypothetical protein